MKYPVKIQTHEQVGCNTRGEPPQSNNTIPPSVLSSANSHPVSKGAFTSRHRILAVMTNASSKGTPHTQGEKSQEGLVYPYDASNQEERAGFALATLPPAVHQLLPQVVPLYTGTGRDPSFPRGKLITRGLPVVQATTWCGCKEFSNQATSVRVLATLSLFVCLNQVFALSLTPKVTEERTERERH